MKVKLSPLTIILVLVVIIAIMECFSGVKNKKEKEIVSQVLVGQYKSDIADISINLIEINSRKKEAKMINKEIRDIFESKAKYVLDNCENYVGNYSVATEYVINSNILSIKIYETSTNDGNSAGTIYSAVYDTRRDMKLNLSTVLSDRHLDYNDEIEKLTNSLYQKPGTIDVIVPYFFINKDNQIELISRSIIKINNNDFWKAIDITPIKEKEEVEIDEGSMKEEITKDNNTNDQKNVKNIKNTK